MTQTKIIGKRKANEHKCRKQISPCCQQHVQNKPILIATQATTVVTLTQVYMNDMEPETKTQVNNVLEATPDGNIPSLDKNIPNKFTPTLTFKNLHRAAESSAPTDPLKSWVWCGWRRHLATFWFISKPPSDCPSVFAISDWCALDGGAGQEAVCL